MDIKVIREDDSSGREKDSKLDAKAFSRRREGTERRKDIWKRALGGRNRELENSIDDVLC